MHSAPSIRSVLLFSVLLAGGLGGSACGPHNRDADAGISKGDWRKEGRASWYGRAFHGKRTANGERFDMHAMTAAHRTLPFGTVLEVTRIDTGKKVRVRINDRGPYAKGRILDLSKAAAKRLDMLKVGVARVRLRIVSVGTAS